MPILKIPTPLRPYTGGQKDIVLPGEFVSEILSAAVDRYPQLKDHLFGEDQQLRPFVNLFLGEENINQLEGLQTGLKENDTLLIIPSIAGGGCSFRRLRRNHAP